MLYVRVVYVTVYIRWTYVGYRLNIRFVVLFWLLLRLEFDGLTTTTS